MKRAEGRDRLEHSHQVAEDPRAKLVPVHVQRAERELAEAQRRSDALNLATESAVDELLADVSEAVLEAARTTRARSAEEVRAAAAMVAAAVDRLEAGLSAAKWASEPGTKRWRQALRQVTVGQGNSAIAIDTMLHALEALPEVLLDLRVADEEEEAAAVRFGHPQEMPVLKGTIGLT